MMLSIENTEEILRKRKGEESINKLGNNMMVIRSESMRRADILVEHIIDGKHIAYIKKDADYYAFQRGIIKSPYDITICGFGYIGEGKYTRSYKDEKGKTVLTKEFKVYESLIIRSQKDGIDIDIEWRNFQEFCKWYNFSLYECEEKLVLLRLSKDIVSSDTCVIIPSSLYFKIVKLFNRETKSEYKSFEYRYKNRDNILNKRVLECLDSLSEWKYIIPKNIYKKIEQELEKLC